VARLESPSYKGFEQAAFICHPDQASEAQSRPERVERIDAQR
jgi:hypothetical protein